MKKATFTGNVKRVTFVNTVARNEHNDDKQTIQVLLGDCAITDGELLELRRFKPGDVVRITVEARQVEFGEGSVLKKEDLQQSLPFDDQQDESPAEPFEGPLLFDPEFADGEDTDEVNEEEDEVYGDDYESDPLGVSTEDDEKISA